LEAITRTLVTNYISTNLKVAGTTSVTPIVTEISTRIGARFIVDPSTNSAIYYLFERIMIGSSMHSNSK